MIFKRQMQNPQRFSKNTFFCSSMHVHRPLQYFNNTLAGHSYAIVNLGQASGTMCRSSSMMSLSLPSTMTCPLKCIMPSLQATRVTVKPRVSPSSGSERYFMTCHTTLIGMGLRKAHARIKHALHCTQTITYGAFARQPLQMSTIRLLLCIRKTWPRTRLEN